MRNTNYKALHRYLIENEMSEHALAVLKDEKHEHLLLMISDHFDDEDMLKDSSTELLKDMFVYYTKHHK